MLALNPTLDLAPFTGRKVRVNLNKPSRSRVGKPAFVTATFVADKLWHVTPEFGADGVGAMCHDFRFPETVWPESTSFHIGYAEDATIEVIE